MTQAVILAAGLGERLRPLTALLPKPLLPLWGTPIIGHTIRALEKFGIRRIAVNLHWQAPQLREYLAAWPGTAEITLSPEQEILGTGGALVPLTDWLADAPFLLVNGDIAWEADLCALVTALGQYDRIAAAWLMPRRGPQTVEYDRRGNIVTYRSRNPGASRTATFCGLQVVSPEIKDFFPDKKHFSVVEAYELAQAAGRPVAGVRLRGSYWRDLGTPRDYLRAHGELKQLAIRRGMENSAYNAALDTFPTTCRTFCCDLSGSGARLANSLLLPGSATTVTGARRCVIGGITLRWPLSDTIVVRATECGDEAVRYALEGLGWSDAAAIFMGKRGSERRFWRLLPAEGSEPPAIVVAYERTRSENGRYAGHAALLTEAGVPVPAVLVDLPQHNVVVLEDWGDDSLQRRMARPNANYLKLYRPVLAAAATLHRQTIKVVRRHNAELEPGFNATIYRWEHELFERHLIVGRYGQQALSEAVKADFNTVSCALSDAPQVVVHRDFQSSNILFKGHRIALIDFQGMRLGPSAYDMASLLCDPYVILDYTARSQLLAEYVKMGAGELDDVVKFFPWAAVQRLTQALGAYGRLTGMGFPFAHYIPAAAAMLGQYAAQCSLTALAREAAQIVEREAVWQARRKPQQSNGKKE